MSRFRPNIVIDGWERPHLVDQASGVKAGPEPIRTLATYRRAPGGGVAFGAKFSVLRTGKLAVGDEITVLSWAEGQAT